MFVLSESDDRSSRVSANNEKVFEFAWRRKHAIYKRPVAVETESKLRLLSARASVCTATRRKRETIPKSWSQISHLRADCGTVNPFIIWQIKHNDFFSSSTTYQCARAWGDGPRAQKLITRSLTHTYPQENDFCHQVFTVYEQQTTPLVDYTPHYKLVDYSPTITNNTWPMY